MPSERVRQSSAVLLVVGFYQAYFSRIFLSCVILLLFAC